MSTKLEALVNVLKADGVEENEVIEALIVEYFTQQYLSEYDVNGNTYIVLDQNEIDNLLYDIAEEEADELKSDMEEIIRKHRNFEMIEMLETMSTDKCIDIMLKSYGDDKLGEKQDMTLILEEGGYFIYMKN